MLLYTNKHRQKMNLFILVHLVEGIVNQLVALGAPYFTMSPSIWQLITNPRKGRYLGATNCRLRLRCCEICAYVCQKKHIPWFYIILYPIYIPPRYIPCIVMSLVSIYPLYFQCIPIISLLYVSPCVHIPIVWPYCIPSLSLSCPSFKSLHTSLCPLPPEWSKICVEPVHTSTMVSEGVSY